MNGAAELFAELDPPLIEGIDVPDHTLAKHLVLIQGDQRAERSRVQSVEQDRCAGPCAAALLVHWPKRPTGKQRFALTQTVCQQPAMMLIESRLRSSGMPGLYASDEICAECSAALV
jgi:hypothetical protein